MNEKVIEFVRNGNEDATDVEDKFKLIQDLAKCLKTKVSIEMVQLVRIRYEASQVELEGVLKVLSGNLPHQARADDPKEEVGKQVKRRGPGRPKMGKHEEIKPKRVSDMMLEKDLDMLGS